MMMAVVIALLNRILTVFCDTERLTPVKLGFKKGACNVFAYVTIFFCFLNTLALAQTAFCLNTVELDVFLFCSLLSTVLLLERECGLVGVVRLQQMIKSSTLGCFIDGIIVSYNIFVTRFRRNKK